jgi:hypothetical protein
VRHNLWLEHGLLTDLEDGLRAVVILAVLVPAKTCGMLQRGCCGIQLPGPGIRGRLCSSLRSPAQPVNCLGAPPTLPLDCRSLESPSDIVVIVVARLWDER